jgi:hypothetical protein
MTWLTFSGLHGGISQKTELFISNGMRTSERHNLNQDILTGYILSTSASVCC